MTAVCLVLTAAAAGAAAHATPTPVATVLTQARPGAPTGTYNLVPAGLAQTKRRFLAARFPEKVCGCALHSALRRLTGC